MTQEHIDYYNSLNVNTKELSITLIQERFKVSWSEAIKIVYSLKQRGFLPDRGKDEGKE
jgi:hypothetical protein